MVSKYLVFAIMVGIASTTLSLENPEASAQGAIYTLSVTPYNTNSLLASTGVDILIENANTGYYQYIEYLGLPPQEIITYWQDSQMPAGSNFRVCGYYHSTQGLINCEYYQAGTSTWEIAPLNLSP